MTGSEPQPQKQGVPLRPAPSAQRESAPLTQRLSGESRSAHLSSGSPGRSARRAKAKDSSSRKVNTGKVTASTGSTPSPRPRSRRRSRSSGLGLLAGRALVLSIVLGVLLGSLAQLWRASPPETQAEAVQPPTREEPPAPTPAATLGLKQEAVDLRQQLLALNTAPGLTVGAVFVDIDQGEYVDIDGDKAFSAASTIKVPVLVALLQAVDRQEVRLDEDLTLTQALMGGGAGSLQYKPLGTKISVLDAATLMITISDNVATNLIIDKLGGLEKVNQTIQQWGLHQTQLSALLPDLEGTNTTSAKEMVTLLSLVEQGQLLSLRSRDRLMDIMSRTRIQTLLPKGLGPEARIVHKTGDIRSMVGDVGIIDIPNGERYLAAVLVKRETPNNTQANELIRQYSSTVYQYWERSSPQSSPPNPVMEGNPTPAPPPEP